MTAPPETQTFMPRTKAALAVCLVATAALTAADLGTKAWALDRLSADRVGDPPPICQPDEHGYIQYQRARMEPIEVFDGWFELRYAENCGAAFGLLREASQAVRHAVFGTAAVLASLALLWMFATGRGGPWFAYSVPFIVSGAIGNLVDRLRLGYVVDFLRVYWDHPLPLIGSEWPTFNVADVTITVGVGFLLIDGWLEGRREKALAKVASAGSGDAGKGDARKGDARSKGNAGQGDAGQGDAGQGDAGQGDAGQGDAGQGDAGQGDADQGDEGAEKPARA